MLDGVANRCADVLETLGAVILDTVEVGVELLGVPERPANLDPCPPETTVAGELVVPPAEVLGPEDGVEYLCPDITELAVVVLAVKVLVLTDVVVGGPEAEEEWNERDEGGGRNSVQRSRLLPEELLRP